MFLISQACILPSRLLFVMQQCLLCLLHELSLGVALGLALWLGVRLTCLVGIQSLCLVYLRHVLSRSMRCSSACKPEVQACGVLFLHWFFLVTGPYKTLLQLVLLCWVHFYNVGCTKQQLGLLSGWQGQKRMFLFVNLVGGVLGVKHLWCPAKFLDCISQCIEF